MVLKNDRRLGAVSAKFFYTHNCENPTLFLFLGGGIENPIHFYVLHSFPRNTLFCDVCTFIHFCVDLMSQKYIKMYFLRRAYTQTTMSSLLPISTTIPNTMVENNAIDDSTSLSDVFLRCDGDSSDGDGVDVPLLPRRWGV